MADPGYSVILPAHDEEATIGRALAAMGAGHDMANRQVIIACNACADRTAEIAGLPHPAPKSSKWPRAASGGR